MSKKYTLKNKDISLTEAEVKELASQVLEEEGLAELEVAETEETESGLMRRFKGFKEEDEKSYWKPGEGEEYWFVDDFGAVQRSSWAGNNVDKFRLSQGNVFKTKEEAEKYRDYLKAEGKIRMAILEKNEGWEPELGDIKYELSYNFKKHKWEPNWTEGDWYGVIGTWAKSRKVINEVIENYPEELEVIKEYLKEHQ